MKPIKSLALVLLLGLVGAICASGATQEQTQSCITDNKDACCATSSAGCCKDGAECCKDDGKQSCKTDGSCCAAHHKTGGNDEANACPMSKDEASCCAQGKDCGGGCKSRREKSTER